jgi:hypothetical protein
VISIFPSLIPTWNYVRWFGTVDWIRGAGVAISIESCKESLELPAFGLDTPKRCNGLDLSVLNTYKNGHILGCSTQFHLLSGPALLAPLPLHGRTLMKALWPATTVYGPLSTPVFCLWRSYSMGDLHGYLESA